MCVIKDGGRGRGGHSYSAQVSARDMQTFCPLTPGTRPWRVGCRAIAPEPQSLSAVSGYLPHSPLARPKRLRLRVWQQLHERSYTRGRWVSLSELWNYEGKGKEVLQRAILALQDEQDHQPIRSIGSIRTAPTQYI